MSGLRLLLCLIQPDLQLLIRGVIPHVWVLLQNIWSEECFIGWFNQLARDKIIPDYPALRKGKAS